MAVVYEELPRPKWLLDQNEPPMEAEFPSWSKKDVLTFIIGQKYSLFPRLKVLPRINDVEAPDLFTIESRISVLTEYGPKEILEDLSGLGSYIKDLYEHKKLEKKQKYRLLRSANEVLKMVKEELEKFETCPDCVAHYYNTNDYFTVPCESLHNVVYVKRGGANWPAKTIEVKNDKVLVAYFGNYGKSNFVHHQEWIPFYACTMASTCFGYEIVSRSHKHAIMEMGTYIQMVARKLKRYYKGFQCHGRFGRHGVTFQPEFLKIPENLLVVEPPGQSCECCNTPIQKSVTIKLAARKTPMVAKKPNEVQRVLFKYARLCDRTGCEDVATQQCFFCIDGAFCSTLCSHIGFQEHRLICRRNKRIGSSRGSKN